MAHHVYQTDAFVLRGINVSEGNRFISVFTRELGFVRAIAKSARKEQSKLRFSLQDHTFLDIALVRGRAVWRITGATELYNIFYQFRAHPDKLIVYKKISLLLTRLLHGEEKNEKLFSALESFVAYLLENKLTKEEYQAIEYIMILRILYHLGYAKGDKDFLEEYTFTNEIFEYVLKDKKNIVSTINTALQNSQL